MIAVERAGVDTWSHGWYLDRDGSTAKFLREHASIPAAEGRGRLLEQKVAGHRVGWFPASAMLFAEGHPAGEERLGSPAALCELKEQLVADMAEHGVEAPQERLREPWRPSTSAGRSHHETAPTAWVGEAGVRRLDVTVDLRAETAAEGLALMAGIAALRFPGSQTVVRRENGGPRVETVEIKGRDGRKTLGRVYDKGVERVASMRHKDAARGFLIRPEDQRRWPREHRRATEELSPAYVRSLFHRRFVPLWRATKGVTVAAPLQLAQKLAERHDEGALTAAQMEQACAFLLLESAGCWRGSRTTHYRRRRLLSDQGLVLADGVLEEVEVDVHSALEQVMDASFDPEP